MTTKFEQLIEYVINDEQGKARELFHDIVVEKSRQIYEEMMQDEELDESEEDLEEGDLGGDQADDLIDDVEADETDMMEQDDEELDMDMDMVDGDDQDADMDGDEELEDRVVDLEDKLDELMAEFEELMGDDQGGDDEEIETDMDVDMATDDDMGTDAEEVEDDEFETEGMMEAVNLKPAPAPVKSEEAGINKKSAVAANAGGKGPIGNSVKPVKTGGDQGGHHDSAAYKNTVKELQGDFQNKAGGNMKDPKPATKPQLGQAAGVNTRSPVSKG